MTNSRLLRENCSEGQVADRTDAGERWGSREDRGAEAESREGDGMG